MCPLPCNSEGSPASSPRTLPRNLDGCRTPLLSPTFSLDDSSDELMGSHGTNTEPIITPQSRSSPISTWQESTWFCSPVVALINRNEEAQLPKCFSSNPNQQVPPNSPNRDDPRDENDTTENVALKYNRETFCDVQETYKNGLLPCFVSLISDHCDSNSSSSGKSSREEEVRWNGHLPLSQMPDRPSTQIPTWLLEQRPKLFLKSPLLDHNAEKPCPLLQSTFPVTLTGPEVEIFFHSNDNSDNNAADDGKKVFRRPNSAQSLSIPSGQAAKIAKDVSTRIAKTETAVAVNEPETPMVRPDGIEIVQTPRVGSDPSCMKELPPLRDAPPAKREELFIAKLRLCGVIYSFDDPSADKRGKDMKRQTLLELVDYVNTPAGQKIFTESVMGDLMAMVSANVCRALPPATDDFDPEEDEPVLEPAWPHLQVAYEFFLRFIVSSEVNAKAAKKYVDQKFCLQLVELFDSEDPRERDYLKTILHRIYGKFMSHRSFIRRAISNVFYRFVYETERHNGIGELLEILGSIINGFAIPLKKEHLQFLVRALIPLHKPKCVALYHQQLSYCIIQYVEKDADTAIPILEGFFRCWPWSCSGKQVMFLNELEEILELLGADQLAQVSTTLFTNLARCLDSDHFQVVERALFLWNNEHLVNSGCLSRLNAQTVLPIIYGPLYKNSSGHWNATVEGLAQNVLKMYMEYDLVLYDKCTAAYFREEEEAKRKLEAVVEKWNSIEKDALAKKAVAPV